MEMRRMLSWRPGMMRAKGWPGQSRKSLEVSRMNGIEAERSVRTRKATACKYMTSSRCFATSYCPLSLSLLISACSDFAIGTTSIGVGPEIRAARHVENDGWCCHIGLLSFDSGASVGPNAYKSYFGDGVGSGH
jgi:hypothetical protein